MCDRNTFADLRKLHSNAHIPFRTYIKHMVLSTTGKFAGKSTEAFRSPMQVTVHSSIPSFVNSLHQDETVNVNLEPIIL